MKTAAAADESKPDKNEEEERRPDARNSAVSNRSRSDMGGEDEEVKGTRRNLFKKKR